ncbi:MAG: Protein of unknown function metallopeptidase-related protein [Herbinix sp.]|jgi:predicted metal-dependent peptidase|nr:Protein of unknown function metallopeptidase-related protein [Herbinix sp.]
METYFDHQANELLDKAYKIIQSDREQNQTNRNSKLTIPADFAKEFYSLIDRVTLSLMEDKDNFYGYFVFQISRDIRFDISSPTAVNFIGASYVIYYNPILFLNLTMRQMESSMKHEILHIVSMHLKRAKEFQRKYSNLAINMAMDIVVNKYLNHLPPYATTLEWVNLHYNLNLEPYASFEYYVEKLQAAIDLIDDDENASEDDNNDENNDDCIETIETEYNAAKTHAIWSELNDIDESTLQLFTEKVIEASEKGEIPTYLKNMISSLKNSKGELPWNLYLKRLMGTVESNKKKTVTRRSRRQPDRLDLRGELRSHKANVIVAIDISGSISDEEFKQAMKEVLAIVKNYNHEVTVIECDSDIRHVYKVKSIKDIKDRTNKRGSTRFSPVFEYVNHHKGNLLVYFTDGKGEERLSILPRGYQILWVISGRGDKLSLKEPYGAVKKLSHVEIKEDILDSTDVASGGFSMNYQEKII